MFTPGQSKYRLAHRDTAQTDIHQLVRCRDMSYSLQIALNNLSDTLFINYQSQITPRWSRRTNQLLLSVYNRNVQNRKFLTVKKLNFYRKFNQLIAIASTHSHFMNTFVKSRKFFTLKQLLNKQFLKQLLIIVPYSFLVNSCGSQNTFQKTFPTYFFHENV